MSWITCRNSATFRLFRGHNSFSVGVGSVLDVYRPLRSIYNENVTDDEADGNAIASDWHAIGDDMRHAFKKYERCRS